MEKCARVAASTVAEVEISITQHRPAGTIDGGLATGGRPLSDIPPTGQELAGEEPEEPTRADAEHWARTYARLTEFTAEMLQRTYAFLEIMPGPAQRHLRNTNIRVMDEELTLFRERMRIWERRARELGSGEAGPAADPHTG